MIGLSLSFCIEDIIIGKVNIDDVEKIITSTAWTDDIVDEHVAQYCQQYWGDDPAQARFVFYQLWDEGKIEQPRLINPNYVHNHALGQGGKFGPWWINQP